MKKLAVVFACLALSGCGSFPLGKVYPEKSQTRRERDADLFYCKDWSKTATETSARNVASFFAGMTIIGLPIAIHSAQERQRELFAECMRERGYRVETP